MGLLTINFRAILPKLKTPLKEGKEVGFMKGFNDLYSYFKSFEIKSLPYFVATVVGFETTTQDTILNLTHHLYYKLSSKIAVVTDQTIVVYANQIQQTTKEYIATGRFLESKNALFDFLTQNLSDISNHKTFTSII